MKIERWAIARVIPYEKNPRKNDAAVTNVMASIKEFGWRQPLVVDKKNVLIVGHTRLKAAQKLGLTHVPVHRATELTDSQVKAYRLMDNRSNEDAEWDLELLQFEIRDLEDAGFGLDKTGFNDAELNQLLARGTVGLTDPDEAPPLPEKPVTALGDVWLLGKHRLVCGDSTVATVVAEALGGRKPHLMVTDPPYGVNYDPSWRKKVNEKDGKKSDGTATGKVLNDDRADRREAWALFPGHVAYVWHGGLHTSVVQESLKAMKFEVRAQLIWVKQRPALSRGAYHWQHEPALYAVKEKAKDDHWRFEEDHAVALYSVKEQAPNAGWEGGRKQSTVWHIEHLKNDTGHGTQKPVECMARPMRNNSKAGDLVYEPFSGSGSTIIAGEMTGRTVLACELNPAYVDVAVERWQAFTGREATLAADGKTFAEWAKARGIKRVPAAAPAGASKGGKLSRPKKKNRAVKPPAG